MENDDLIFVSNIDKRMVDHMKAVFELLRIPEAYVILPKALSMTGEEVTECVALYVRPEYSGYVNRVYSLSCKLSREYEEQLIQRGYDKKTIGRELVYLGCERYWDSDSGKGD